jgi:ATP phosphoribosyltransferase
MPIDAPSLTPIINVQSTSSVSFSLQSSMLSNSFIPESGDTMRAAGLHPIATVLQTDAVLIKSSKPKHPNLVPLIDLITSRIAGVIAAWKYVVCEYNIPRAVLSKATALTPGRKAPTISPLEAEDWASVCSMVEKKKIAEIMDGLVAIGAEDIMIFNLDNCRV